MPDSGLAVQTAIYERLTEALAPTPVYDHVPQDSPPLYVQVGEDVGGPGGSKNVDGAEHVIEINVYSNKRGYTEAKQTIGLIYDALHRKPLYPAGFDRALPMFDFREVFPEPDGVRGVIRFRLNT